MENKNSYFPVTRLRPNHTLIEWRLNKWHRYEIINNNEPAWLSIVVECDGRDNVTKVEKAETFKKEDNGLYLSLKNFKGKIYWDRHFKYAI